MNQPTKEELRRAIAHARDARFAELVALVIGLAAETHPEILKKALAGVFDLSFYESRAMQAKDALLVTQAGVEEARHDLEEIRKELETVSQQVYDLWPKPKPAPANGTATPTQKVGK